MHKFIALIICLFGFFQSYSQVPHLKGKFYLDLETGYLAGDVELSNLPDLSKNYRILLNRGLNIKHVKVDSLPLFYQYWNVKTDLYSAEYALLKNENDTIESPEKIKVSYVGAFPVYENEFNSFDDMGIIAHNGKTLRANPQSGWYPLIKDLSSNKFYSSYTYNLTIECPKCQEIYVNGNAPAKGGKSRFVSEKPRELLLFAGNFTFEEFDDAVYINSSLGKEESQLFSDLIGEITNFYEYKIGIQFTDKPVFLHHNPIERFNPGRTWGFVVYPTFATAGIESQSNLNLKKGDFHSFNNYAFFAHELGHFYFGTLFHSNSTLQHFFGESFPEYLALKAVSDKYGNDSLVNMVQHKFSSLKKYQTEGKKIIPIYKISDAEQINGLYRYSLGPLILLYLDKVIGEEKVFNLIRLIINDKASIQTDYHYFIKKLKEAGIEQKTIKKIKSKVFENINYLAELEFMLLNKM